MKQALKKKKQGIREKTKKIQSQTLIVSFGQPIRPLFLVRFFFCV